MAIPISINELINGGVVESNRIEYKADFNPTPIVHSICAFANDIDNIGGGYIVIGVEEEDGCPKLPVKGIEKSRIDGILKKLLGLCRFIEPFYEPIAEPMMIDDRYVIVLWCSGGFGRPYKAPKDAVAKQSIKYYYIRKFSSSVIASPMEEKELFYISETIPFDDRPNLTASLADLDLNLIREHLRRTGSSLMNHIKERSLTELSEDMQLLDGPPENRMPRNVALLMFSDHPQKFFPYARIEIVSIPNADGSGMTEMTFDGTLQIQLSGALQYLKNNVLQEKIIKHDSTARADRIWNYPYRAVEEILSNAVYHRSYQIREPITVRITRDSMEIQSFPGFDRSITDEDILHGNIRGRRYRNRRIGDFLKELGMIEGRNTGFPNAYEALKNNGSPQLSFSMDPDRTYLAVTIRIHPAFTGAGAGRSREYEKKIMDVIGAEELTITEISQRMGYRAISKKLRSFIDRMTAEGLLEMHTDSKNLRKYRIR